MEAMMKEIKIDLNKVKLTEDEVKAIKSEMAESETETENGWKHDITYTKNCENSVSEEKDQEKRLIVLDGQNICYDELNNFNFQRLLKTIDFFENLEFKTIVIMPKKREIILFNDKQWDTLCLYKILVERGVLIQSPDFCYDDFFMIDFAARTKAIVVSNDRFYDIFKKGTHSHRAQIMERRLPYCFIENEFVLPIDPRGKIGPELPEFLHFPKNTDPEQVNIGETTYFEEFKEFLKGTNRMF